MTAHRIEATTTEDNTLTLTDLPFPPGTDVEVVIRLRRPSNDPDDPNPLRGSILWYDDPFEPAVPPEDWEALR